MTVNWGNLRSKKNDWENIIAFWKKSKQSKALDNKCHAFENFAVFTFI